MRLESSSNMLVGQDESGRRDRGATDVIDTQGGLEKKYLYFSAVKFPRPSTLAE